MSESNWFCISSPHDWLKNSRLFFIQSEVLQKPLVTRSHTFSRVWRPLHVVQVLIGSLDFGVLSDWPNWLHWFWFYDTQLKTALIS